MVKPTQLLLLHNLEASESKKFEIVERKGIGHPDTLADGVAESISRAYSLYCLQKFGVVLHQTLDKIVFLGGLGKFGYGIGEMTKPWRIILDGRLSDRLGNEKIPFQDIEINATKEYLKKVVPRLDIEKWLKIEMYTTSFSKNPKWFSPDSINDIPDATRPYSNDTSTCVGYWPLSITEKLALQLEGYFYNVDGSPKFSYIGQDIKVMCVRKEKNIEITMCVPFFAQDTPNANVYYSRKKAICSQLYELANIFVKGNYRIKLYVNTQDGMVKTNSKSVGHYFVISGSALDSGEEGVVGRGNRSRGIISTIRPVNMEAVCGKNPVYYVGKVYTYLADKLAQTISESLECECNVYISSRNSDDLYRPYNIFVETTKKRTKREISKIIEKELEERNWTNEILNNKPFVPFPGSGNGYNSLLNR